MKQELDPLFTIIRYTLNLTYPHTKVANHRGFLGTMAYWGYEGCGVLLVEYYVVLKTVASTRCHYYLVPVH